MKHIGQLLLLGIAYVALQSCSGKGISSFEWRSPSGKGYSFYQTASFPAGKEQIFTNRNNRNRYVLKAEPEESSGQMLVVKVDVSAPAANIDFELSSNAKKAGIRFSFAVPIGVTHISMPLEQRGLQSIEIAIEATSKVPEGGEIARIISINHEEQFAGFQTIDSKTRKISSGFSASQGTSGSSVWQILPIRNEQPNVQTLVLEYENRSEVEIHISGKRKLILRGSSSLLGSRIPLHLLLDSMDDGPIGIDAPITVSLKSAYIETNKNSLDQRVDLGAVLLAKQPLSSSDYIYYFWDILPDVLVLDFSDYKTQDSYLKRLAFFVEKKGFVGRLAKNEEIASLHGWNAHDYKAEDLGRFFDQAKKTNFQLNPEEERLKELLLEKGIIEKTGLGYRGKAGALISITRESPQYLRRTFMTHEASHAIFFVDKDYRALVQAMWAAMPRDERYFWYLYFGWMNYDTSSDYLMANEMQSYLVQQSLRANRQYFSKTLYDRLLEHHPELEPKLQAYFEEYGGEFEKKAAKLDTWLKDRYGFGAGMLFFLR